MEGGQTPPITFSCKYCGVSSKEIFCKLACEIKYREEQLQEEQFKK